MVQAVTNLLCVANYPEETSYAWRTIRALYARLAVRLRPLGVETYVIHRQRGKAGSTEQRDDYRVISEGYRDHRELVGIVRRHTIRACYFTDADLISLLYARLRRAGAGTIVVHERTSGERTAPRGIKRWLKQASMRVASITASRYIAVSDFVAQRLIRTGLVPRHKVIRIHNGIEVERFSAHADSHVQRVIGTDPGTPVVFCAARANRYKGISTMIEAAGLLQQTEAGAPHFVYCGDGPDLDAFRGEVAEKGLADRFHLLGERADVARLLGSATVAVVPSHWEEAFGLSVVESMASGVPVVATSVGGIPEIVDDGKTGILVPPADAQALAGAVGRLLSDPGLRESIAGRAREVARSSFDLDRVADEVAAVFAELLSPAGSEVTNS